VVGVALAILNPGTQAQYQFLTTTGDTGQNDVLRFFRVNADDSLTEVDSITTSNNLNLTTYLDPRGRWVYVPFAGVFDGTDFYELTASGEVILRDMQGGGFAFSDGRAAVRPDGAGVINTQALQTIGWYRFFRVTDELHLVPEGASHELAPGESILQGDISVRGAFTIFTQTQTEYRTYPLAPNGDIGAPTPDVSWDTNGNFIARALGVSRDGRVIISAGNGDRDAVSLWVADDGSVTEIDSLPRQQPFRLVGGNAANVLFPHHRYWVVFHGDWTEIWALNPDGTFGERIDITFDTQNFGRAALSADGRCAVAFHIQPTRSLSVLRLKPTGEIVSITRHTVPYFAEGLNFVTRRRPGDCNGDGWLDATDVVCLVNHVTQGTDIPNPVDFDHADVDGDGRRDQDDIEALVDLILGETL
jgi:hypothetical protein